MKCWLLLLVRRFGKLADATQAAKLSPAMAHLSTTTATLRIMDVKAVARIVKTADIGMGEAFMLREIETDDLLSVMWVMSGNAKVPKLSMLRHSSLNRVFPTEPTVCDVLTTKKWVLARQTSSGGIMDANHLLGRESQENRPWAS